MLKKLETQRDEQLMRIKEFVEEHSLLVAPDGKTPLATWKAHEQKFFEKARLEEDQPGLVDEYTITKTVRPLRLKGKKILTPLIDARLAELAEAKEGESHDEDN